MYSWSDFKSKIRGDVKIKASDFCHACSKDLFLLNGNVHIHGNQAYYECKIGYILQGNPIRTCLRTSEWTQDYPYCKSNFLFFLCYEKKSGINAFILFFFSRRLSYTS